MEEVEEELDLNDLGDDGESDLTFVQVRVEER